MWAKMFLGTHADHPDNEHELKGMKGDRKNVAVKQLHVALAEEPVWQLLSSFFIDAQHDDDVH